MVILISATVSSQNGHISPGRLRQGRPGRHTWSRLQMQYRQTNTPPHAERPRMESAWTRQRASSQGAGRAREVRRKASRRIDADSMAVRKVSRSPTPWLSHTCSPHLHPQEVPQRARPTGRISSSANRCRIRTLSYRWSLKRSAQ